MRKIDYIIVSLIVTLPIVALLLIFKLLQDLSLSFK
jgi:hypothetical protein